MHDCSVRIGDAWLARNVPRILRLLSGRDLLFLLFEEGTTSEGGGGHVACIVAGPGAKRMKTSSIRFSHFSLLRTVEDRFGLSHLGHAADPEVKAMDDLLR
jgi:phosphatidylinositol-3-phosphatase